MQKPLDDLIALLDLEELEVNLFRGRSPQENRQRVFGGQVAGQALVAAGRTVERGTVHSLHAYFLRPGDPATPILYLVDRIRDGRTFTTRRVVAIQHGRAIFHLSASFQPEEDGPDHGLPMPAAPDPESLPSFADWVAPRLTGLPEGVRQWFSRDRPIDMRHVEPMDPFRPVERAPRQLVWIRASGRLPDPLLLHQCVVAYASDLTLLDTATLAGAARGDRSARRSGRARPRARVIAAVEGARRPGHGGRRRAGDRRARRLERHLPVRRPAAQDRRRLEAHDALSAELVGHLR